MHRQPEEFGRELRRLRMAAGLTLADLATAVHYSKGQLSKVERGQKPPSRALARLCDTALDAGGALLALLPEPHPVRLAANRYDDEVEVWEMRLSAQGPGWFQPASRREVMGAGLASAVGVSLGGSGAPTGAETEALLRASRTLFDDYRRLGQSVGPALLLPTLIAQTHTLRELAGHARGQARTGLLRLGSRYAEYIGWLVQETGNDEASLWWTQRAVAMAAAGGDHDLAAYALVRRALVTLYRGDAGQTVSLAQLARSGGLPPRIRGLAAQREAQGHALAGDELNSMRCLEEARDLLGRDAPSPDGPVLGSMHLPDPVAMIRGWCLFDLGRPAQAAQAIDEQLRLLPPHALRTRVRFAARRALAYAEAGDIDHACELARELLRTAPAVNSATVAADIRALARVLARHPRNASVKDLTPDLTTFLPPSTYRGDDRA
ncbi:helix-turn-helix domain-containing protein [Streptomyces sp. NPDC004031]